MIKSISVYVLDAADTLLKVDHGCCREQYPLKSVMVQTKGILKAVEHEIEALKACLNMPCFSQQELREDISMLSEVANYIENN